MKLTNAYIIDGDVIKKMILESKKERDDSFSLKMFESAQRQQGMIDCLEVLLNEHLKPALPIVEEAFESGWYADMKVGESLEPSKQDFLTKDF